MGKRLKHRIPEREDYAIGGSVLLSIREDGK